MVKIKQNPLLHSIRRQVVPERIIQKDPTLRDSRHSRGCEYQRIKKKKKKKKNVEIPELCFHLVLRALEIRLIP